MFDIVKFKYSTRNSKLWMLTDHLRVFDVIYVQTLDCNIFM